jgi:hypothetical protein
MASRSLLLTISSFRRLNITITANMEEQLRNYSSTLCGIRQSLQWPHALTNSYYTTQTLIAQTLRPTPNFSRTFTGLK